MERQSTRAQAVCMIWQAHSGSFKLRDWFRAQQQAQFQVLDPKSFHKLLGDDFQWAARTVPFFETEDQDITTAYYYRWSVYR